jgi:hypothetical protein
MSFEEALFKSFITLNRQNRYIELLGSSRGRKKLCDRLNHSLSKDLDPRYCRRLSPQEQNPSAILSLLTSFGAPTKCRVLSDNADIDGRELDLRETLNQVVGYGYGTLLSCVPDRLAYYEAEDPGYRYICHRKT